MKNRRIEWKNFQGCFKNKKEEKYMKWLSFITQLKIDFLLPITSCRKVLRKMFVYEWFAIFKVIMHEKQGNHIKINLKFVHLGLQKVFFFYLRGSPGSLLPKVLPCPRCHPIVLPQKCWLSRSFWSFCPKCPLTSWTLLGNPGMLTWRNTLW